MLPIAETAAAQSLRIALVCPYDWSVEGGVRTHVRQLAAHFRRDGHLVTVFAPASDPVTAAYECVPMGRPRSVHAMGTVARVRLGWEAAAAERALKCEHFDVVHVHEPLMPALPYAFLRASRNLTIGTFHAAREEGNLLYSLSKPLLRRLQRRLHGKVAVSPAARALVGRYFPDEYRVIPNGIEHDRWATPREPWPEFDDGRLNILFVGRPEKRKGLDYMLDAFKTIAASRDDVRLIVAGAGDFSRYEATVPPGCEVVFRPNVPEADLPRYHYSAHVFCCPNTGGESQGYVLMEAMAAGRAVVATDIPGFASVARDGIDALLVPPRSPEALAAAISALLDDPALRTTLGCNARLRAAEFNWDGIAAAVMAYYRELLAGIQVAGKVRAG